MDMDAPQNIDSNRDALRHTPEHRSWPSRGEWPGNLDDSEYSAERLIQQMQSACEQRCSDTGLRVGLHEYLLCIIYGYADQPMTWSALAKRVGVDEAKLCGEAWAYIEARDCFREAWAWASEQEPRAAILDLVKGLRRGSERKLPSSSSLESSKISHNDPILHEVAGEWDAQDMACGDLLLELRWRLAELEPGEILRIRATDLSAPEDIPAWCGLVGHSLLAEKHPFYWIQRRQN